MKKHIALLIVILIVLIIPVGLFGLISSEAGSQWLLRKVFSALPAQVSVATIQGRLIDRVSLADFHYQSDTETIAIKDLAFSWQPYELFSGTLKIVDVVVNGLCVSVIDAKEPQKESSFDLNAELLLPVQIVIENFLLTDMQFHKADFVQDLEKLQLALVTEGNQLKINKLAVNAQPLAATVQGQITLGKGFPFSLTSDWQVNAEKNGLWQGSTTISGDINKLSFDSHLSSPFTVVLKGTLDDLQNAPRITTRADWSKVMWPITGATPRLQSEQGTIELDGLLDDYQVTLNGQFTQQYLPEASLSFNGKGSQNALSIEKLELKSKTGLFQINGNVSWQDAPAFDLTATGQNFNPAMLLPEMPGSLSFSSRVKGKLDAKALQINADINKLSGQLRGYPLSVIGKLVLNGDQLKVDALRINSGTNKIAVNGTLGQEQAALDVSIDTPALDALWPTLGGSLKGNGFVQGTWKNPTVKFQAKGKRLRFAEHSAGQIAINIDYYSESKKTSRILLSASAIKSGAVQIDSVLGDGLGTLEQHSFKADINSAEGDLSTALTGNLKAGNWKGDISKLDLNSQDLGLWQLKRNLAVSLLQRPSGVDVALDEVCLVQKNASICSHGHFLANGDLNFALKAIALPTRLMKPYLPEQMQLNGTLNADMEIQRQKSLLSGRYQLDMSLATLSLQSKEVSLGASSLSGKLKGDTLTADIDLALAGQDSVRGRLQMDTGKTQTLSGQITASVTEFALLNPYVLQLSNIKGQLNADLALHGTLEKPVASGAIRFTGGAVDVNELGLALREIRLQALASGDNADRIQMTGSAKSGEGTVNLDGFAVLQAQAGWPVELMLKGENFEAAKIPEAQIAVSPDLKFVFAESQGKVTGTLKVPKAVMILKEFPENAVKVSPDEIILGQEKVEENRLAAPGIDANIDVELGKQVSFSGQGLTTNLAGKLKIVKTGQKMAMHGNVDMIKARYKSYGQDLTVRKGRFVFNGPVDNPWLDVEAIRVSKSKKVTAILGLTGTLQKPETRISSEPALPEAEALAYLVTGGPLNQVSKSEGNMLAGAALSYGGGQAAWITDKLGIDEFEVQEGEKLQDTLVAVGQYLTPDFYVGAKVGLFNKQAAMVLKHKITNAINVETQAGTSQRVKLNYEIDTD